jgi:RNA polymerase sigma-70 factor (ECF subfamily)
VGRLIDIDPPADLLSRAAGRDEAAQAQLYAEVGPAAFALIRRIVGVKALAEDLFQDTMVTMFEHLGQFRGEAPFGAWVRQIAVSKALMYLRSPWHRLRLGVEPAEPTEWSRNLGGEQLDLERALAQLSPTARAVVWLYEVEGYTHEEIAAQFGQSVSFSKSQLARAHRRLRACFEPAPPAACAGVARQI